MADIKLKPINGGMLIYIDGNCISDVKQIGAIRNVTGEPCLDFTMETGQESWSS